nr:protein FAR1-RELATED SEQUENCE 3-like [Arachis hypogaea]
MQHERMKVLRNHRLVNHTRPFIEKRFPVYVYLLKASVSHYVHGYINFEEALYDTAYDVSEHSNSTDVNVLSLSEDDTPLVEQGKESEDVIQKKDDAMAINDELPDHTGISIEEIPYVGLRFDSLQRAQEFYSNYGKKVGFVTRIRNTNFDKTKKELKNNDEAEIRPNKTYLALANEVGGSSKLGYSEKDVRNYIARNLRCVDVNADVKEMISYFMRMRDINSNFFYAVNVDETNKFKSALWVDAKCRASYEYFGDVVSFDTTYSRNKYVCVSAFICMGTLPQAFITDRCKSMFGAIRNVFPDTRHRWCIWHIMKKIPHKLKRYARYREIDAKMHATVWNAHSKESFEKDCYLFMMVILALICFGFVDLYDDCRMWVPIYFQGEFELFVHEYDNVLGNKEQKELEDDAVDSKGVVPCLSKVSTKGRLRLKRLGSELDTSIKKSMRRKKKNPPPEVNQAMNPDIVGVMLEERINHRNMAGSCRC